jgi:hypothetical protein
MTANQHVLRTARRISKAVKNPTLR